MAVLVRDDVGDGEVAGRSAVALGAAGKRVIERSLVDVGGELLRDVDGVVAGAVGGGAVAEGAALAAARARSGLAGRDPGVADPGLGETRTREDLRPVGVNVRRGGREEGLDGLRLVACVAFVGPRGAEELRGPGKCEHQSGAGEEAGAGLDLHGRAGTQALLKADLGFPNDSPTIG